MLRQVSVKGFQLSRSVGSVAGASGMAWLTRQPRPASTTTATATASGPSGLMPISTPPTIVPTRIAPKVPDSTSALPPTNSRLSSACGRMPYLSGPKSVDCNPIRKRQTKSSARLPVTKAKAATAMTATSSSLVQRISIDFS